MRICICGGGNLGHVVAGFLAAHADAEVSLLTRHPERWQQQLSISTPEGATLQGRLSRISSNPQEVVRQADIVLLCLPGFSIREELTPLFGFQRVPFISRIKEYGRSANLLGYKPSLHIAIEQTTRKEVLRATMQQLFCVPVQLLKSYYEVSLTNSNPLLHPARLYTLWSDWHEGVTYPEETLFYEQWTDEASALLIQMDEEFQQLLCVLPVTKGSIPTILDYYESTDAPSLTRKLRSIQAFKGIKAPMKPCTGGFEPDFSSRYFTEDFPYGLQIIQHQAQEHHVATPVIDRVLSWGLPQVAKFAPDAT